MDSTCIPTMRSIVGASLQRGACFRARGLTVILAAGLSPADLRAEEFLPVPVVRASLGPVLEMPDGATSLAFDGTIGVSMITDDDAGLWLNGELGGTYESRGYGAFQMTAGIGYGTVVFAATYQPRLLIGSYDRWDSGIGQLTFGMRNSLIAHFLADSIAVEFGWEFLSTAPLTHDARLMFSLNPMPLFMVLDAVSKWKFP